jgi:hypothetical protein
MKQKITLIFIAALLPALCAAQWLWLDEAGRRVYSDQPPPPAVPPARILRQPGVAAPALWTASSPASGAAPSSPAPRAARAASSPPSEMPGEEALRALRDDNARLRAAHCTRLRDAWATLESGVRLARTLPNGEREVLDDAARAAERQRLQGLLASDCPAV